MFLGFSFLSILISIDLGDESMRVSELRRGSPVRIVLTSEGRRYTSSVASLIPIDDSAPLIITEESPNQFHRIVGDLSLIQRFPMNSARYLPLLLGKNYSSKLVGRLLKQNLTMPYDSNEDKYIDLIFPPEFFAAQLIQSAIKNFQASNINQSVDYVNIVVPKFFTHSQRKSILHSAKLTTYKGHITDNTAAIGTLFAIEKSQLFKKDPLYVLFIDFGAHSIQASIMEFSYNAGSISIEELGYDFNDDRGGYTIDTTIARAIRRQLLKEKPQANISEKTTQKMLTYARKLKHELTLQKKVTLFLEDLVSGYDMSFTMTQENLKKAASPELRALNETLWGAMDKAGFSSYEDLDRIELIGGGSRMPIVTEMINSIFSGKVPIMHSLNAEEATVIGSGYVEANKRPGFLSQDIKFIPYPLYNITFTTTNDRFVTYQYAEKKGEKLHLPLGIKKFIGSFDKGDKGSPQIDQGIVRARGSRKMTLTGLSKERMFNLQKIMRAFEKIEKKEADQNRRLHEYETFLLDTREKLTKDEAVIAVSSKEERDRALKIIASQMFTLSSEETNRADISEQDISDMKKEVEEVSMDLIKKGDERRDAPEEFQKLERLLDKVTKAVLEEWPQQGVRPKTAFKKNLGRICGKVSKYIKAHKDLNDMNTDDIKVLYEKLMNAFENTKEALKEIHPQSSDL